MRDIYHLSSFGCVCYSLTCKQGLLAIVSKPHGAVGLALTKNPQLPLETSGQAIFRQIDQPLEDPAFWKVLPSTPFQAAGEAESVGTRQRLLWVTDGKDLCLLENQHTGWAESFIGQTEGTMF